MRVFFLIWTLLLSPALALATGGVGSTCDPSKPGWSTCTKETVPWAASVTNTVNVSGGTWSSPYAASASNTKYVLQGNVTANSTGFNVTGNYVTIDLNGYTLTYNQTSAGEGIRTGDWGKHHLAVINGSVIQGAAASAGNSVAFGNAAITSIAGSSDWESTDIFVANVYTRRNGKDVGGIIFQYADNAIIKQSTLEDAYFPGVVTNRHSGIPDAIHVRNNSEVANCTIINARQRGVRIGANGLVHDCHINLRSIDTNSYGVFTWKVSGVRVYDTTITGNGTHPIGIGFMSEDYNSQNLYAYRNNITLQKTSQCGDPSGDEASGVRAGSYGASLDQYTNGHIYDNDITIYTDDAYPGVNCETGAALTVVSRGKGLFIGPKSPSSLYLDNNRITMIGDGPGKGISPMVNTEDNVFFTRNTISSGYANVVLADNYVGMEGYPLFLQNTFIKTGSSSSYATIADTNGGWFSSESRFVDNIYQGGASASSHSLEPGGPGTFAVYFGHMDAGVPKYDSKLSDSGSSTISTPYATPITLAYAYPTTCNELSSLCTSEAACTSSWPGYAWSGGVCGPTTSTPSTITCYQDADGDLYGSGSSESVTTCSSGYYVASHFTATTGDCNDSSASIHPGVTDVCGNGVDEDCSGSDAVCSASGKIKFQTGGARFQAGGARLQ